jgi:hypothetical protein
MPRISSFYGITIAMFYDENHHRGRPHFHASYGDAEASIDIWDFSLIVGQLPRRAQRLVIEWARLHQAELLENWKRARVHQPLKTIEPLG